jgi:hypothetical protein
MSMSASRFRKLVEINLEIESPKKVLSSPDGLENTI